MHTFERGAVHPTAVVSASARLADDVTIGAFTVVHDGVSLGAGSVVGSHCVLGEPTADFYGDHPDERAPCTIGAAAVIRSHTVVYRGATLGDGFECGHRVTIREGTAVGRGVRVGTGSDLQGDLTVGDHTRIHSGVFVPAATTIEELVWLFPAVTLTNDPHPPSDTCTVGPTIRRLAAVGAGAVVLPGVEVGEGALVGAGSLVTSDVEPGMVVRGSPARVVGPVTDVECRHGALDHVYPWPDHFRRGYPDGVLPEPGRSR